MNLLGIAHSWVPIDILKSESRTLAFQAMNANMKVPVLELENNVYISESNAILNYLAAGTSFLPNDNYQRALVLQWQFFEQYSHEPFIATARFINKYLGLPDERKAEFFSKQEGGHRALEVMEDQLLKGAFLTGEHFTIADISLYAYTHVAHEGRFDLGNYPAIQRWITNISHTENYISMDDAAKSLYSS
jgi:glutathione S-transferase